MKFDNFLSYRIIYTFNILWVSFDKMLKSNGLSSGQVFILTELWKTDGINQTELALRLNVSTPTVSKMVSSLCANKFTISRRSKLDRRTTNIFLTEKGKAFEDSTFECWQVFDQELFADFSETEKLILLQLNEKLKTFLLK